MTNLWVVRAGRGGVAAERFVDEGYVEVGFGGSIGPSVKGMSREAIAEQLRRLTPDRKEGQVLNTAAQLYRFHEEIQIGDDVVTYDPEHRRYLLGQVLTAAEFAPSDVHPTYRRRIDWTHRVDRDVLSVDTRNTLGSTLTLFRPNDSAATELRQRRVGLDVPITAPPPDAVIEAPDAVGLEEIGVAMEEKARDFIEDRIARLGPYEMQDLVAGILRAMGYKSRVSPPGPDGGHDIFASPDGLGLEEPRIFVEVKHRTGTPMGAPAIRSFLGGRRPGDRCLYVSTGGFTKDAKSEAQRASVPLTLVDLGQLRELLIDYYDKVDPETQQLVPLKRLYWPIEVSD